MLQFTEKEKKLFKKLNTPMKVQDFLNKIPINFERNKKDTIKSPLMVLRKGTAHCMEGAILAALALRVNNYPPLLVDLTANKHDFDHVITVFKQYGKWGAITKTNHAVLRYREPVYNSIRELAMSYFHEYFNAKGVKTLRSFTNPVNLKRFDKKNWMTTKEEVDYIPDYLESIKHFPILQRKQIHNLRKADDIEIKAGKIVEWKSKHAKDNL